MRIDNKASWWPRLLPLLAATIAVGVDAWVVAGFLPDMGDDLGVSTATAGLSVTVFAVAYAFGAPVLAALTSTIRARRVIAIALAILAVANLLCALSPEFTTFLVGRVLAALAASIITPAAGVLAARVADEEHRGRALALVIAGLTIATAIGVPIGGALASITSWRVALGGVALLAAIAAGLIRLTAPDTPGGARQRVAERLQPLKQGRILAIMWLTVLGMSAAYVPYAYVTQLLPSGASGWLLGVLTAYGVGAVAGSLGSGTLTDRIGSNRTLTIAYSLMAASFLALATRPPVALVLVVAAFWGAACWMQTPPQQDRLLRSAPVSGSVTIGTNASALYAGIAIGNAVGAGLLETGSRGMCLVAAGGAVLALAWNTSLSARFHRDASVSGKSDRSDRTTDDIVGECSVSLHEVEEVHSRGRA